MNSWAALNAGGGGAGADQRAEGIELGIGMCPIECKKMIDFVNVEEWIEWN
jgi:hypothetical protein